jgi:TRAP-type transport system small permease protein
VNNETASHPGRVGSIIENVLKKANIVTCAVGALVLAVMMLLSCADVIGRYFFNKPIPGVWEIIRFLLVFAVSWGIGYTQIQKDHIRINIIIALFPKRVQAAFDSLSYFLGVVGLSFLCWQLVVLANKYRMMPGAVTETLGIPFYPFILALAIPIAMLILVLILDFVNSLLKVRQK